jgi:hypothetical protein
MDDGLHRDVMLAAVAEERAGHRALLDGEHAVAAAAYGRATDGYLASWDLAPPRSYGRLVGAMKAAVLGDGARSSRATETAGRVRAALAGDEDAVGSPVAAYAGAVAALVAGESADVPPLAAVMAGAAPPFARTAAALAALAATDGHAYEAALDAIVADFESRDEHLTGVPIADTAVLLEALAEPRDLRVRPTSALVPVPV